MTRARPTPSMSIGPGSPPPAFQTSPCTTAPPRVARVSSPRARRSHLDLLVRDHALHGGALEHAVLERGVVLELAHRQLAAHAPAVEHEAIGIEHGILVAEPFPARQHAVNLLEIAVEGLQAGLLDAGKGGLIGGVALG